MHAIISSIHASMHSPTHALTCSFHPFLHSFRPPSLLSCFHSSVHSFMHSCTHTCHSSVHSLMSWAHPCIPPVASFVRDSLHSLIHQLSHSSVPITNTITSFHLIHPFVDLMSLHCCALAPMHLFIDSSQFRLISSRRSCIHLFMHSSHPFIHTLIHSFFMHSLHFISFLHAPISFTN